MEPFFQKPKWPWGFHFIINLNLGFTIYICNSSYYFPEEGFFPLGKPVFLLSYRTVIGNSWFPPGFGFAHHYPGLELQKAFCSPGGPAPGWSGSPTLSTNLKLERHIFSLGTISIRHSTFRIFAVAFRGVQNVDFLFFPKWNYTPSIPSNRASSTNTGWRR